MRFNRGTRWGRRETGIGIAGGGKGPSGGGFRRGIGSEEDEEDENGENGEKESGGFEEGDRECHAIPKRNQIKASIFSATESGKQNLGINEIKYQSIAKTKHFEEDRLKRLNGCLGTIQNRSKNVATLKDTILDAFSSE